MRRWIPRCLWLLAWTVWLWLGWGLYKELPREWGPVSARLPLRDSDTPKGFIAGEDLFVTDNNAIGNGAQQRYTVWEVGAERRREEVVGPTNWNGGRAAIDQGVAVGLFRGSEGSGPEEMQSVDLRTGAAKRLGPPTWSLLALDRTAARAAFVSDVGARVRAKLIVVDTRTGERLVEWTDAAGRLEIRDGQFLDGADELAITATAVGAVKVDEPQTIVHLSASRGELKRFRVGRPKSFVGPMGRSGRVLTFGSEDGVTGIAEVWEIATPRMVFSSESLPAELRTHAEEEWNSPPRLSADGRRLLTDRPSLWSVDEHRPLWDKTDVDLTRTGEPTASLFQIQEDWAPVLDLLHIKHNSTTWAVRSFETGRVVFRSWKDVDLSCVSSDNRRFVDSEGGVRPFPPPANWIGVILAEAVLASPMVLLWLALRWRRRKARMASAAP